MAANKTIQKTLIPKENFSEWYDNVLLEAKIVDDRYPVKGFTVYTGWGFSIVKRIISMLEEKLDSSGHEPMQFPVIIPEDAFQKEEDHIKGFSGEVFWITHAGENELERRLVLRPTSETAIYPMFKMWIRSHADLPLLMNQTCNVYRYETKATRPLYRGREFLWNEGHTAHATYNEAEEQIRTAIRIYSEVYDSLSLNYIKLRRPDFDKFAGADYSVAFDAWNPDGKSNQIGTVHQLGNNFAKAFEMTYENEDGKQELCTNTCYGMGFGRTLACLISQHGDDHGLILPPIVAPKQVVIIPIPVKGKEQISKEYAKLIYHNLTSNNIRTVLDEDDRLRPGEKFYKWEMNGVPIRIEIGPREAESKTVTFVRRDTFKKSKADLVNLVDTVHELFKSINQTLNERSKKIMNERMATAYTLDELKEFMDQRKLVRINWCGNKGCAEALKDKVSGEIRGTLWLDLEEPTDNCILCENSAKYIAYVSRTY
ncbi:proline--tRNA ligase [Candidatus Bathyarchaeota archaeon]|nr:proline--tRNA ligase [Candidatus Bathyarchaeota archaeon]